ncbi:hypothetical protein HJG60_010526 [Phyllostomus discolor]|uniref:Deoxyribonuclease-2-beta n=1 Tax=Phyllostomus discolor TaxID=89673 RepID=A0A834AHI6_9CHIR|nr:hypothetical protein HJG60_010526 [Phyllostomus discolor]
MVPSWRSGGRGGAPVVSAERCTRLPPPAVAAPISSAGVTSQRSVDNYTYPQVSDYKLEGVFIKKLPDLEEVVKGYYAHYRPWNSSVTLPSKAGAILQSFAKFGRFGDDLYSGWLVEAEALGSNLQVQF